MALLVGLAGAGTAAQAPEFTQQYLQRLGGAVDELGAVVADFDRSAEAAGLDREAALSELSGSAFLDARGSDMARVLDRHERLSRDLARLRAAGPLERAALLPAHLDGEIGRQALADYEPALPATPAGAGYGALGFALGWVAVSTLAQAGAVLRGRARGR